MQTITGLLKQSLVKAIIKARFRFTSDHMTNIPASGPAVLAVNSVSFLDPLLVLAALGRPALFLANSHDLEQTRPS
jgi:1-acyl-sn-glycerol-3-phosphate acyltransferase